MNRREFLHRLGTTSALLLPAAATEAQVRVSPSSEALWTQPRQLWITRPDSQESGRFTYWENGEVIESEFKALCHLMRDLHANKSVAMHIGLINFQYVLQQGMNYYFGEEPYVLTDGYRTERTNASIENAAKKSQHLEAAASDGRFEKATIEQQFKLASWFDVGGVGIYPHHVHIDAGRRRRWAGGYQTKQVKLK